MIIKPKDDITAQITQLEQIKAIPNLDAKTRQQVEKELKILQFGAKGEEDSAYFIDFHYGDSENWIILHDLRLKHQNRVAQIDHILLNRIMHCYVLETKNYRHGIKITDRGEFLTWNGRQYVGIESPILQNQRHVDVLSQFLQDTDLLPKRLGLTLKLAFHPYILMSPKSRIIRPKSKVFNTDMVIKADALQQQISDAFDKTSLFSQLSHIPQIISPETLIELGQGLARCHQPLRPNYYARFGIQPTQPKLNIQSNTQAESTANLPTVTNSSPLSTAKATPKPTPQTAVNSTSKPVPKVTPSPAPASSSTPSTQRPNSRYFCFQCKKGISQKVALFCFGNKARFGGKAYCFDCQTQFPK